MATPITAQTPVEIDTALSDNYQAQAKLEVRIQAALRHIDRLRKSRHASPVDISHEQGRLAGLQVELREVIAASAPFQVEFNRRGGWLRYFLVTNGNGHVHRGLNCQTCFPTTQYSWLVDLADCDEDAMIEEWGERACTVCFPTAPTNPLYHRPARVDREAQEARAAEKAQREAAKAEKAITDVDGTPLRIDGNVLRTKVAARNELSSLIENICYGYGPRYEALVRQLVPALDAAGVDWLKSATAKVAKVRKEASKPNPWAHQLTAEQVADSAAKVQAGIARAEALLQEVAAG